MKVLVLGGSELQYNLVKNITDHLFIFVDSNVNCWIAKNTEYIFYPIDFSNVNAILTLIELESIELVVNNTDKGVLYNEIYCSYLKNVIPSLGHSHLNGNKYLQRLHFERNDFLQPSWSLYTGKDYPDFPFIVKPLSSSGSRGVEMVSSISQFKRYLNESNHDFYLCEDRIIGDEYSVEGFYFNETLYIFGITEKKKYKSEKYFVESGHIFPARINTRLAKSILEYTEKVIKSIRLPTFIPFHLEIISNDLGIYLVEIAFRPGGDNITNKLVSYSYGFEYFNIFIEKERNIIIQNWDKYNPSRFAIQFDNKMDIEGEIIENTENRNGQKVITNSFDRGGYKIIKLVENGRNNS